MIVSKQLEGGSSAPTLELEVTYGSYEIANNRTPVTYVFRILRPSSISSEANKGYSIHIGDQTITGTTIVGGSGTKNIKSGNLYISHNTDGTKTINCGFSINIAITWSGTYNGIITASDTLKLPTIPRKTTPTLSASSVNIGGSVTINTPRKVDTFTHTLYILMGDSQVNIATGVALSCEWTLPNSIASYITKTKSLTCKVYCATYDGSNLIGKENVSLTVIVPNTATFLPSASVTVTDDDGLTGYVEGKTKLTVSITSSGQFSSTIKDITTTLNGVTYKGSSFTTGTLNFSTTKTMTTKVTDSRGYSKSVTTDITPMAYSSPQISAFSVQRCGSDGTLSESGLYLKITYGFSISSLDSQNTKNVSFYYESSGGSATFHTITDAYSGTGSFVTSITFSTSVAFKLRMSVTDRYSTNKSFIDLPTEVVTLDIRPSGNGMAFGKMAETDDLLDINWDVKFKDDEEWTNLTLESAFIPYNSNTANTPKYRIRDHLVEIRGIVSPSTAYTSSATDVTITNLPSEIYPSDAVYEVCQGSGINKWLLRILPTGALSVSRYGISSYAEIPTGAWLVFHVMYLI